MNTSMVVLLFTNFIIFSSSSMEFSCTSDSSSELKKISVPKEVIINIFDFVITSRTFPLKELAKLRLVNKPLRAIAEEMGATIHSIDENYWQNLSEETKSQYGNQHIKMLFATAIAHNIGFWLEPFLKDPKYLIHAGQRINNTNYPLHIAAQHDADTAAKLLLKAGADFNKGDGSAKIIPAIMAISNCCNKVAELLINAEYERQSKTNHNQQWIWDNLKQTAQLSNNDDIIRYIDQKIIPFLPKR